MSTQAIDKYKNGVSDIMNMRLKHAIKMTEYANQLKKQSDVYLIITFLTEISANKKTVALCYRC
ncbi:hypothetical protein [Streptococcus lactarius]|uniref:hypothetical protein n=1 Tax=Streptococcus lactarius TaxID=684066 RepID=UPI00360A4572